MQLIELEIKNFKCITSARLELADVNILVGANGSGKSSIIQATHLACCVMRQANRVEQQKTSTVSIEELDYLPTDNYKMLAFRDEWGNKTGTPSSEVSLTFQSANGDRNIASCELRSARNAGISIKGEVPNVLTDKLRRKRSFFSAYIPGISGIPNKEEKRSKKVVLKACSYGDSNIILRNVLLLLKEEDERNIELIQGWISQLIGPVQIIVEHDEERDLIVDCKIEISGDTRPIELIGTGYLQLIQIFSYVLLFNPGILLIDEPDIHLHPTVQEKLCKVFSQVASEKNLRVLLTTHSPFILRGAPPNAKVNWLQSGTIESQNRTEVELALGWGAFGKKIIIISEDKNLDLLKKIICQWPELDKLIAFYPGSGYRNLVTPEQADEIREALANKYKILVHRDRDSLNDSEVEQLQQSYTDHSVGLWFTELSDVEAYFCKSNFLQDFLQCSEEESNAYVEEILTQKQQDIKNKFNSQRAAHNSELYKEGGSPTNDEVWEIFQGRPLKGANGKFIFNQLKNKIPHNVFKIDAIQRHSLGIEIAPELKVYLEQLLAE